MKRIWERYLEWRSTPTERKPTVQVISKVDASAQDLAHIPIKFNTRDSAL